VNNAINYSGFVDLIKKPPQKTMEDLTVTSLSPPKNQMTIISILSPSVACLKMADQGRK
jgi:hypothetical protein